MKRSKLIEYWLVRTVLAVCGILFVLVAGARFQVFSNIDNAIMSQAVLAEGIVMLVIGVVILIAVCGWKRDASGDDHFSLK